MNLIKNLLRSIVPGCFASAGGCGCLIFLILGAIGYYGASLEYNTDAKSYPCMLVIDLSQPIVDAATTSDEFTFSSTEKGGISICDFERKILKAAKDDNIYGIAIVGSFTETSLAQISEIRKHLETFKDSAKPVYAYLENAGLAEYFLASAATEIFINPFGNIEFKGLSINSAYFANALKKYGVDVQVIKAGKYKSFGEMFTSDKMSEENKEILSSIANDIWDGILEKVGASREINTDLLKEISNKNSLLDASEAVEKKMADTLAYRDEFILKMSDFVGTDKSIKSFNQVLISSYALDNTSSSDKFAVVYFDGEIVDSDTIQSGKVSSRPYCDILRDLTEDDSVKGVILRINSPGGSAYASEEIRHAVEILKQKKPVFASLGDTAASGAYWIASSANKIIAQENTITGSIGVFAIKLSGGKLANDFGITFDGVETANMADIDSLTKPLDKSEIAVFQKSIDSVYDKFIKTVSKGRSLPESEVLKVAEGKIFLASSSQETKLFDEIGGLSATIALCAKTNSAEEILNLNIVEYPAAITVEDFLMNFLTQEKPFAKIKNYIFESIAPRHFEFIFEKDSIRAQMPFLLEIK